MAGSSASATSSVQIYTSALVSSEVQQYVTTVLTTSGSQTIEAAVTTSRTIEHTTGTATATNPAQLSSSGDSSSSSGLSDNSKKIIGGVVGGVGGAIVIGALALVAWRLWGRKKGRSDEDDDPLAGEALGKEHRASQGGNNPFQTNLESHHAGAARPNVGANF